MAEDDETHKRNVPTVEQLVVGVRFAFRIFPNYKAHFLSTSLACFCRAIIKKIIEYLVGFHT